MPTWVRWMATALRSLHPAQHLLVALTIRGAHAQLNPVGPSLEELLLTQHHLRRALVVEYSSVQQPVVPPQDGLGAGGTGNIIDGFALSFFVFGFSGPN